MYIPEFAPFLISFARKIPPGHNAPSLPKCHGKEDSFTGISVPYYIVNLHAKEGNGRSYRESGHKVAAVGPYVPLKALRAGLSQNEQTGLKTSPKPPQKGSKKGKIPNNHLFFGKVCLHLQSRKFGYEVSEPIPVLLIDSESNIIN